MAPKGQRWDDAAQRDLCLAIIQSTQARLNWPAIVSIMHDLGYSFTKDAVSQQFTKVIAKDFKARVAQGVAQRENGTEGDAPAPPPRAVPRKRGPNKAGGAASKKRSKGQEVNGDGDGDDAGDGGPSAKRVQVKSEAY